MIAKLNPIIVDGIMNILDLYKYSPCVTNIYKENLNLLIQISPTVSRDLNYYEKLSKHIITRMKKVLRLNFIKSSLKGYTINLVFELKNEEDLLIFFRLYKTV